MTTKKYWRVLALSLVLVTLLTLCSCSASREARPTNRANKVVATVDELDITYDTLYYITMTRIAELKRADENALSTPEQREELAAFVKEHLLTRSEALILIGKENGLEIDKGVIAAAVQEDMDNILNNTFAGDRKKYIESLNAEYLTDRYVRSYLAVEEHLPAALIEKMLKDGQIDDSNETAEALINGNDFIRTIHVFISKTNAYTDAENRAHAAAVQSAVAAKLTDGERYDEMHDQIGGKYNNDMGDTLGNGYYFAKGEMEEAYEQAAFALPEYGVSPVVETADGFYIIMRMPKSADYIEENFQYLKEKSYYLALNRMVEERYATLTLEMTRYGNSLDLMDLPPIDADGGEAGFVILITVSVVASIAIIAFTCTFIVKRRGTGSKKGNVRLLSRKAKK